jgi:hypothetical protein
LRRRKNLGAWILPSFALIENENGKGSERKEIRTRGKKYKKERPEKKDKQETEEIKKRRK